MAKPKNKTTKSKFDATKLFVGALTIPAAELDLFKQWVNIVEQIQRNTPIDQIPCPSHPYILQGLMVSLEFPPHRFLAVPFSQESVF